MGFFFRAGEIIAFDGNATDIEDGELPPSAYSWNVDFHHDSHVHPSLPLTNTTNGTFEIPSTGHDFSGFTRYEIRLTVTDSDGLRNSNVCVSFSGKGRSDF